MSRIIETANSTYELDEVGKRVRRVKGANPPTDNFKEDGLWHEVDWWRKRQNGMIFWFRNGGVTVTSPVKE